MGRHAGDGRESSDEEIDMHGSENQPSQDGDDSDDEWADESNVFSILMRRTQDDAKKVESEAWPSDFSLSSCGACSVDSDDELDLGHLGRRRSRMTHPCAQGDCGCQAHPESSGECASDVKTHPDAAGKCDVSVRRCDVVAGAQTPIPKQEKEAKEKEEKTKAKVIDGGSRRNRWTKTKEKVKDGTRERTRAKDDDAGDWTKVTSRRNRRRSNRADAEPITAVRDMADKVNRAIMSADDKINKIDKDVNVLTKHTNEATNNLGRNEGQRFPEQIIIDSGVAEIVLPSHWMDNYKMMESNGSKDGVFYLTASGQPIYNEGEKTLLLMNEYGQSRMMTFQCAKTTKALGSVSKICSNGNRVVFDDEGSYIENKVTGEKLWLEQSEGGYHLNMQVAPNGYNESPFGRQGP